MYKLTFIFDGASETEHFSTRGNALQFAKVAARDGLLIESNGGQTYYPYFTIKKVLIEKTDSVGVKSDRPHPVQ